MDFPRHVYTVPGPNSGVGFLPGYTWGSEIVNDEDEGNAALEAGFANTPQGAVDLYEKAKEPKAEKPKAAKDK